jgi:hypothetical protein
LRHHFNRLIGKNAANRSYPYPPVFISLTVLSVGVLTVIDDSGTNTHLYKYTWGCLTQSVPLLDWNLEPVPYGLDQF